MMTMQDSFAQLKHGEALPWNGRHLDLKHDGSIKHEVNTHLETSSNTFLQPDAEEERGETCSLKYRPSPGARSLRPHHAGPRDFCTRKQQPWHLLPKRPEHRLLAFRAFARRRPADGIHPWPWPSCAAIAWPNVRACRTIHIHKLVMANIARTQWQQTQPMFCSGFINETEISPINKALFWHST